MQIRQRGLTYPYEIDADAGTARRRARRADFPPGEFVEYDLDEDDRLVPVERPYGENTAEHRGRG